MSQPSPKPEQALCSPDPVWGAAGQAAAPQMGSQGPEAQEQMSHNVPHKSAFTFNWCSLMRNSHLPTKGSQRLAWCSQQRPKPKLETNSYLVWWQWNDEDIRQITLSESGEWPWTLCLLPWEDSAPDPNLLKYFTIFGCQVGSPGWFRWGLTLKSPKENQGCPPSGWGG